MGGGLWNRSQSNLFQNSPSNRLEGEFWNRLLGDLFHNPPSTKKASMHVHWLLAKWDISIMWDKNIVAVFCDKNRKIHFFCILWFFFDFSKPKKNRKKFFSKLKILKKVFFSKFFRFDKSKKKSKNAKNLYFPIFIAKYGHDGFVPHDRNVPFR